MSFYTAHGATEGIEIVSTFVNFQQPQSPTMGATTFALGEEGGNQNPRPTTLALGEEGGTTQPPLYTTLSVGEEGGLQEPPVVLQQPVSTYDALIFAQQADRASTQPNQLTSKAEIDALLGQYQQYQSQLVQFVQQNPAYTQAYTGLNQLLTQRVKAGQVLSSFFDTFAEASSRFDAMTLRGIVTVASRDFNWVDISNRDVTNTGLRSFPTWYGLYGNGPFLGQQVGSTSTQPLT